jgi:hypothetical protein
VINGRVVVGDGKTMAANRVLEGSGRGSTGAGHKLVRQAGGHLTHLDHIRFLVGKPSRD